MSTSVPHPYYILFLDFSFCTQQQDRGRQTQAYSRSLTHTQDPLNASRIIRDLTNKLCNMFLHWMEHWRTCIEETGSRDGELTEIRMKGLKVGDMTQPYIDDCIDRSSANEMYSTPSAFFMFYCFATLNHSGCRKKADLLFRNHQHLHLNVLFISSSSAIYCNNWSTPFGDTHCTRPSATTELFKHLNDYTQWGKQGVTLNKRSFYEEIARISNFCIFDCMAK